MAKILVLGGSGVLGGELVRQLRAAGYEVLATATSVESAARIPNEASLRLLLDLRSPESIEILANYLNDSLDNLTGIVNAAGVAAFGELANSDTVEQVFEINAIGPIEFAQKMLPLLRKSSNVENKTFFAAITGVVAEQPMPGMALYSASKSALSGYLRAMAKQERKNGVRFIDLRPGHTETGLANRPVQGEAPTMPTGMTPESVASKIVAAIQSEESELAASAFN